MRSLLGELPAADRWTGPDHFARPTTACRWPAWSAGSGLAQPGEISRASYGVSTALPTVRCLNPRTNASNTCLWRCAMHLRLTNHSASACVLSRSSALAFAAAKSAAIAALCYSSACQLLIAPA